MIEFENKNPEELQKLIADAQAQLEALQRSRRVEVIAKIKDLAATIGVSVEIYEDFKTSKKPLVALLAKYRNPDDYSETWTGRGVPPKWIKDLIAKGHQKHEFLINI